MACGVEKDVMLEMVGSYIEANCIAAKGVVAVAFQTLEDFQIAEFAEKLVAFATTGGCEDE